MGRLSWIIWMGPFYRPPYKRGKQEGQSQRRCGNANKGQGQREIWRHYTDAFGDGERRPWAKDGRQRLEARRHEETDSSLESIDGMQPCQRFDFSPVKFFF